MRRLTVLACAVEGLLTIAGIAAAYLGIWTHSEDWGYTAALTLVIAMFGAVGCAALIGMAAEA